MPTTDTQPRDRSTRASTLLCAICVARAAQFSTVINGRRYRSCKSCTFGVAVGPKNAPDTGSNGYMRARVLAVVRHNPGIEAVEIREILEVASGTREAVAFAAVISRMGREGELEREGKAPTFRYRLPSARSRS